MRWVAVIWMLAWVVSVAVGTGGCRLDLPEGQSPVAAMIGKLMPNRVAMGREALYASLTSDDADLRREGVLALGKGKWPNAPTTPELLGVFAMEDPDPLVRATAVQSLAKLHGHPKMGEILQAVSQDDSALVRWEGVKALGAHAGSESLTILLDRVASDADASVRAEAAGMLVAYRDLRGLRVLVQGMDDDSFQVSYRARQSLRKLTGKDFEYDVLAWQSWLATAEEPFATLAGDYH